MWNKSAKDAVIDFLSDPTPIENVKLMLPDGRILVRLRSISDHLGLPQSEVADVLHSLGFKRIKIKMVGGIYRMWVGKLPKKEVA